MFGVPHADFGEAVMVAIVRDDQAGGATEELSLAALDKALEGQLARFKQPKHIVSLSELPRNTMGKVQKNQLRKDHASLFENTA